MKQHITVEQLQELTEENQAKLCNLIWDRGHLMYLDSVKEALAERINIGKMIEIISQCEYLQISLWSSWKVCICNYETCAEIHNEKLCDALWKIIKPILEREVEEK